MAANQLVMMQAKTSLIFKKAFSSPGIAPQMAPAAQPPRNATSQINAGGTDSEGMPSASIKVTMVPMRYCPGAPMLNSPVLKATATERPVKINGVPRKSIFPMLVGLKPKVKFPAASRPVLNRPPKIKRIPSQALERVRLRLVKPTTRTITQPTASPIRMERIEARTERTLSRSSKEEPCFFILLPPSYPALRRTYTGPALGCSFSWGPAPLRSPLRT